MLCVHRPEESVRYPPLSFEARFLPATLTVFGKAGSQEAPAIILSPVSLALGLQAQGVPHSACYVGTGVNRGPHSCTRIRVLNLWGNPAAHLLAFIHSGWFPVWLAEWWPSCQIKNWESFHFRESLMDKNEFWISGKHDESAHTELPLYSFPNNFLGFWSGSIFYDICTGT